MDAALKPSSLSSAPARPSHGGNLAWAAALAGCSPTEILDFSASINPLGAPASVWQTLQASLADLRHYPDPSYLTLRQALSQYHDLPIEWILPGNGSAELLTWVSRELAALPQVFLPTPAFGDYFRALKAFNATIVPQLLPDLGKPILPPLAAPGCQNSAKPQAGCLINNPHNPTGCLFPIDTLRPLLDRFALVVVDEAFMDFLSPTDQQSLVTAVVDYPNLVILRSLTKFYSLPGLRLGYAIAHPDRLQRWQSWRDPWSVNSLAAAAAIACIQDHRFQQITWNWLPPARSQLFDGIAGFEPLQPYAGQANFLLVRCQTAVSQLQQDLLMRHRVLIRDCLSFPELGETYFRVAVRTETENQRLLDGLADVF